MPSLKDATKKPANVGEPIEVAAPAIAQRPPAPPYVPNPQGGLATGSMGPAPATFTTPYDSIRQFIRPGVAQNRFPPLPVKANPQSNAVARTIATQVAGSTVSKIELEAPSIFTLTDQTVALPGPLVLALAPEPESTVFAGPSLNTSAGGFVESSSAFFNSGPVSPTASLSNTTVTPNATVWLFTCFQAGSGSTNAATGVTVTGGFAAFPSGVETFGSIYNEYFAQTTSGQSFSSTFTYTGQTAPNNRVAGAMVTWSGLIDVALYPGPLYNVSTGNFAAQTGVYFCLLSGGNPILPISQTAGNGLVLALYGVGNGDYCYLAGTLTVTDTAGNKWYQIADSGDVFYHTLNATRCVVFYAPNCAAANPVVTLHSSYDAIAGYYRVFEVTPATPFPVAAVPTFRVLDTSDLPVVDVPHGGTGLATLPAHAVLLGEGAAVLGSAAPSTLGYYLKDNGAGVDPSFAALPTSYYQTVEQATVAKTQRPILNFIAPITATDDAGNTSTDIAVPVFVGSGASHATGLVPDPGASAGTTKFLREDGTWAVAGGAGTAVEVNGVGVSSDKQFYFNGVADVVSVWGVQINGASG